MILYHTSRDQNIIISGQLTDAHQPGGGRKR